MKQRICMMVLGLVVYASAGTPATERKEHIAYWMSTLQSHPMELVRKNAARVLGSMQDRFALSALIQALEDSSYGVRQEAARSLGTLGDEDAVPALQRVLRDETDRHVRYQAREAIDRIKAYQEFQKKKLEKLRKETKAKSP